MKIAFIGLGNMGGGMAANLVKAGHSVNAFDLAEAALSAAKSNGCATFLTVRDAVAAHGRRGAGRGDNDRPPVAYRDEYRHRLVGLDRLEQFGTLAAVPDRFEG